MRACAPACLCPGLGSGGSVRGCESVLVCEASWLLSVRSVQCWSACVCPCMCSCVLQLGVHEHVWGRERRGGHFSVWVPSAWQCLCMWLVVDRKLGLCVCALLGACVMGLEGGRSGGALQEAPFGL